MQKFTAAFILSCLLLTGIVIPHVAEAAPMVGWASFYKHGARTASGEAFNPGAMTAAHPSLPFGTRVRVINVKTGSSVVVRINDRGPFGHGRIIDLSYGAAQAVGIDDTGLAKVRLEVITQPKLGHR